MMETVTIDRLDRKIAHALQLDGRAPFNVIADALGVSDQTVARRYRRLRSAGALRVVGLPDPARVGQVVWALRLRCVPDAAGPIADALARRPDTSWVSLTSAGTEIVCFARAHGPRLRDAPLLDRLPRTPKVIAVTAHCLLHMFAGGPTGWRRRTEALAPEQVRRLRRDPPTGTETLTLSAADEALLAELALDGRTGYPELATATGWSPSTVQRRLEHLRATGALFFDVDIDPELLGYPAEAVLWLSVPPTRLSQVGATLAAHPEVALAAATTGPANLIALVGCRDVHDLYGYITTRLGDIVAIERLETAPVIKHLKRSGALLG
jgi:DNA-binding Lrp family transcriptional regulator